MNETFCFCKIRKHEKSKIGPLFACDICDNWYHSSCVTIDEDYLKCMPVFTCPKCFKDNFFTFSSYAFKKYIENGELNLANVQKDFYKENRTQLQSTRSHKFCINFKETSLEEFTRGIKCYSSRGINKNYNNCYANASFQAILGSSVFDLRLLRREQKTDIKTRLLNLHDALTIENSPLDIEFHLHGSKVINCGELTNDILDNFNYENKEMMDGEEFVLSLLQKIFSEEGKLHTYRLKYLDLKRCARCSSFNENVGESSILRLNLWNCTNQMEVSLFSMLYNYFICDASKNTYDECKENCERKFYQSAKLLLNLSAILIIHTYRATSDVRGKINKTTVKVPNVLDLSPFLAFKKGDNGISTQYQLASAINYRDSYLNSGHYVAFICAEECYMTEFDNARVSLPEIRFENTRSREDTHTLFHISEDKIDVSLQKDAIPNLSLTITKNFHYQIILSWTQ